MMCAGWIRFRASLMAMRRTSWIDQRINDGVSVLLWLQFGVAFFWRRWIGAMADHRHHGEGEHHQRDVAMPPMPGSALVVIESELVFRGLKTVPVHIAGTGWRSRPSIQRRSPTASRLTILRTLLMAACNAARR